MRYDKAFRESGYLSTILTSFEFDPVVFENVALAGLTTGGARDITVIADTARVNTQFTEYGPPQRAGRFYHLAKRQVVGRFHPKIVLQAGEKKARLIVGSANLTGSGIMGNLEAIAVLEAREGDPWAAPLIRAARNYLERHVSRSDVAARAALLRFDTRAPWLMGIEAARSVEAPDGNRHGLLHEDPESGIAQQLVEFIGDDPIHRLVLVSPFWNTDLQAVIDLVSALGNPETSLVLNLCDHPIDPDRIESLGFAIHDAADLPGGENRRLHAKVLVACGARADYTMSGSANMTREGLYGRSGGPGNAEACLVRTETTGAAIERLGLSTCLSKRLKLSDHPPNPRQQRSETEAPAPRDGGSLSMQLGFLTWIPPDGHLPQDCRIALQGAGDTTIETVTLEKAGKRFVARIDHLAPLPRRGRVLFPDGATSAPVPIADVDHLARIGHGRIPTAQSRLLAEIGDMRKFDGQALDLATRIRAMVDAEQNQRGGNRARQTTPQTPKQPEDDATSMTREEFLGTETDADTERAETAYRNSAMGEIRRQIAAALGLGLETWADDFETDIDRAIDAADLAPSDERERDELPEDADDSDAENEAAYDDRTEDQRKPPANDPAPTPIPRHALKATVKKPLSKLETQLAGHITRMREEVRDDMVDVLSLRNSMSITMVIFATLNDAAPLGARPTHERPMPARGTSRSSGWISLLGGLLATCRDRLSHSNALETSLDKERVECLSAILFAVGILADAAKEAQLKPGVYETFQKLHADLGRIAQRATAEKPEVAAYLTKTLSGWDTAYKAAR